MPKIHFLTQVPYVSNLQQTGGYRARQKACTGHQQSSVTNLKTFWFGPVNTFHLLSKYYQIKIAGFVPN